MVDATDRTMNAHSAHPVRDLYVLVGQMGSRFGMRRLGDCSGRLAWPKRGVYFFLDPAEPSPVPYLPGRLVRVGTHALKVGSASTLWGRLAQHRGQGNGSGNHRGSIFRKHVGSSLIARGGLELTTWGVGSSASREARAAERGLEEHVTSYLADLLVTYVPILDEPGPDSLRGFIERNAIGVLSNGTVPGFEASDRWLGRYAPSNAVRESGLWNVRHIGDPVEQPFWEALEALVHG